MKKGEAPPPPLLPSWWRTALTDRNGDFDTGRILTPIVIIGMLIIQTVDTWVNHAKFDAQAFGIGVGAVLAGLAAYLWGDSKPTPPASK